MVLPIGATDQIDARGYVIHDCPVCGRERIFAVYDTRRKLTLFFIPTVNVRTQYVMECTTCHGRWGIPDADRAIVERHLMTQEQVLELMARARAPRPVSPPMPTPRGRTFYQVLQVDPAADHEVIEAAFRRLALKYHPDTTSSEYDAGRLREIIQARDLLLNPDRRAEYDASLGIVCHVEALRPEEV